VSARRRRDLAHWQAVFGSATSARDRRRRAAQVLDALAGGGPVTTAGADLGAASVTVDSPLTPRLTAWLRDGLPGWHVAGLCRAIGEDPAERVAARGDALIAWAAAGADEPARVRAVLAAASRDPGTGRRLRWRLARALFVLRGRVGDSRGDGAGIAQMVGAGSSDPARDWAAVLRARSEFDFQVPLPVPSARAAPLLHLLSGMTADTIDKYYSVAVNLDTNGRHIVAGGEDGLVAALCHLPSLAADLAAPQWLLDVASLATLHPGTVELAYLSACSTTFSAPAELIDESIHLTSGFQLAGFPHVIGTLWPISDMISVDVADAFYGRLAAGPGGQPAPAARPSRCTTRCAQSVPASPGHPALWAPYIHAGA